MTVSANVATVVAQTEVHVVDSVRISGLGRTRESTLLRLLPRPAPARYSSAELAEFERRLTNLAIFDRVRVELEGEQLVISVREKWTLIPSLQLATGSTWRDTSGLLGAVEYNWLGTANQLAVSVFREQRGWGFAVAFSEHPYQRGHWAFGTELSAADVERTFAEGSWHTATLSAALSLSSPRWLSDYLHYSVGALYARESVQDATSAVHPESTHAAASQLAFNWDAYTWDDLAPRGVRAQLGVDIGFLAGRTTLQPRDAARFTTTSSLRLSPSTALLVRAQGLLSTRGNANYNQVLGSIKGVRGLSDGYYYTWAHAFLNVELRQSLRIASRWAIQGVLFSDAATFETLDAAGERSASGTAFSAGVGARLVPTWLANVVLRLDGARLLVPEERWFLQFGLNQYF